MENMLMENIMRSRIFRNSLRGGALGAVALIALTLLSKPAFAAQATYQYTGYNFTQFSCGPNSANTGTISCATPAPANIHTSYTATDHVEATLVLDNPLPANLPYQDIRTFAGFQLTMSDGQHTVATPLGPGQGMFAEVSTDADGNILDWRFVINTGGLLNGGIATYTAPFGFKTDQGTLSCCDPSPGGDFARIANNPGAWNFGTPTPEDAVSSLIIVVSDPLLGLTSGQINSFTDKLNNVLTSIQDGQIKQALNQLKAFNNSVSSSLKNGKISSATAETLLDAANEIIELLNE